MITSCVDERDECKRTADDASKAFRWHRNQGAPLPWEEHSGDTYLTGYAVSACEGGVTLMRALSVRNLRTWLVMLREKAQVAEP